MEINFLKPESKHAIIFLNAALSDSRCIIALWPSSNPYNSFSMLFIHSIFLLCFHIIIIIIKLFWEFFTPALVDRFSQEFERQQASSSLQDSSRYPSRSQQCCSLDGFHTSSYFQIPLSCTNPLGTVPSALITTGITVIFMSHSLFSSLARSWYLSFFLLSFSFTLWSAETTKFTIRQVLFLLSFSFTLWSAETTKFTIRQVLFLLTIIRSGRLAEISWFVCISKSQWIL